VGREWQRREAPFVATRKEGERTRERERERDREKERERENACTIWYFSLFIPYSILTPTYGMLLLKFRAALLSVRVGLAAWERYQTSRNQFPKYKMDITMAHILKSC
jgi:hypothetical protein